MKKYALVALILLGLESRGMTEPLVLEKNDKGAGFSRVLTSIGETGLKVPVWTARFLGRGVKNIVEHPVQSAILFTNLCLVTQAVAAGWRQFCPETVCTYGAYRNVEVEAAMETEASLGG